MECVRIGRHHHHRRRRGWMVERGTSGAGERKGRVPSFNRALLSICLVEFGMMSSRLDWLVEKGATGGRKGPFPVEERKTASRLELDVCIIIIRCHRWGRPARPISIMTSGMRFCFRHLESRARTGPIANQRQQSGRGDSGRGRDRNLPVTVGPSRTPLK